MLDSQTKGSPKDQEGLQASQAPLQQGSAETAPKVEEEILPTLAGDLKEEWETITKEVLEPPLKTLAERKTKAPSAAEGVKQEVDLTETKS